jgi:ubiquinone/menaquinone biosynthesis C-methylase UbiE
MDWRTIRPILEDPTSTVQDKFIAEQKYWNEAAPVLVGPLKKTEFQNLLSTAIDNRINIHDPSIKLLDFGCGIGRIYDALQPQCQYTGVDISSHFLKIFQESIPSVHLIHINNPILPLEDNYFDIITCYSVFTHIPSGPQCEQTLSELYRVLKPKGILLISVFLDIIAAPTTNWIVYTTDYWTNVISSQCLSEHRITLCYECGPDIHQYLYTLVK